MMNVRFLSALIFFLGMLGVMRIQGASLITAASPMGIIDVEFAWTQSAFNEIMFHLDKTDVLINIFLDFAFIASYWLFFATTFDKLNSRELTKSRSRKIFYKIITTAAILDVVENISMLVCVLSTPTDLLLKLTFVAATVKFIAVIVGIIWLLVMLVKFVGGSSGKKA